MVKCVPIRPHVLSPKLLNEFRMNLIFAVHTNSWQENVILVRICHI